MTRHATAALAMALVLSRAMFGQQPQEASAAPGEAANVTHGPMLGRLGSQQIGVWARTARPGTFRVCYGEKAEALNQTSPPATTRLENDCTAWVLIQGLQPGTRYHYRLASTAGALLEPSLGGSFLTLPDARVYRHAAHNPRGLFNFRFEAGSCANQGEHGLGPSLPAYKTMLDQVRGKVHFAIMNGDWLYEEAREFSPQQWLAQVGRSEQELPAVVKLAPSITGMWENYKQYLSRGKNLAAWHRDVPTFFTLDDHEILNDVVGCGEVGLRDRRTVFRDIAEQAWHDYLAWANPTEFTQGIWFGQARLTQAGDVLTDPQADFTRLDLKQAATLHIHWGTPDAGVNDAKLDAVGGDPNAGVYQIVEVLDKNRLRIRPAAKSTGEVRYSIGRRSYYRQRVANCEFYFLDTRSHRHKHDFKQPQRPGISMLGTEQKTWLKEAMSKSDAEFFFVVSSVPMFIPHSGAGGMAAIADDKDDSWTAFVAEREELIRFWDSLAKPVMVLTGDLHNSFAIRASSHVWEFCCGPHNSANHPLGSEGGRPPNGPFDSRGRKVDIRWSTCVLDDVPLELRRRPVYCVVQVNNVFNNPRQPGENRWVAYPRPQVVLQYHDGLTGEFLYSEAVQR